METRGVQQVIHPIEKSLALDREGVTPEKMISTPQEMISTANRRVVHPTEAR
jgi:hypothetical protein